MRAALWCYAIKPLVRVHPERDSLSKEKGLTAGHITVTEVLRQVEGSD